MSTNKRELICIVCPIGCRLEVAEDNGTVTVTGNSCPRGAEYAREELLCPKRVVTATCTLTGSRQTRLPVKTDRPIPAEYVPSLLHDVYSLETAAPVRRGDILLENYMDTEVNLVAAMTIASS